MIARLGNTVGWGLFCAASWTWCIGMYLPIIMLRHWGWPGFWVFAVPNIVGCVGFGYLCRRDTSERLCREHAGAMVLFSAITIAFQLFFVSWVAGAFASLFAKSAGGPAGPLPITWIAPAACLFVATILSLAHERWWPWLGALTTAVSYATWMQLGTGFSIESGVARLAEVPSSGDAPIAKLAMAAPIIVFGFLLCPWLDRTFHRARQRASSPHAFGVFGASFFVVILMTAAYGASGRLNLTTAVIAHLATQLTFTVAAHVRELRLAPVPAGRSRRQMTILAPALVGVLAAEASSFTSADPETTYFLFLGCYGLLFPAYVLLFLRPGGWPVTQPRLTIFGLLVLALSPLAARGFVQLDTRLLLIPVVVLLLAAFAFSRPKPAIPGAPAPDGR